MEVHEQDKLVKFNDNENKHNAEKQDKKEIDQSETYNEPERQFVVFRLDKQEYGIDIDQVYEIERMKEIIISPVPKTPYFIEGIINLRGEIVPIVNLRKKLGLPPKEIDRNTRVLMVKIENKIIGFLVDEVSEVVNIVESKISLPPEEVTSVSAKFIIGVARLERRLILLLNINEVMALEEKCLHDNS